MKKKALAAILLAGCMILVTGCQSGKTTKDAETSASSSSTANESKDGGTSAPSSSAAKETKGASTEKVTLKVANYAVLEKGYESFWKGVKEGFEAKYPNVTLEWVTAPYGEVLNQVINMAGGGDKVDCVFGEDSWIPSLVEAGLAAPMDQVLDPDFMNDYYPDALTPHVMNGKVYAVPLYLTPPVLFYNKDLFKEAGLDPNKPPVTYDEMLVMAEKLSKLKSPDGNKVFAFGYPTGSVPVVGSYLQALVKNFGGEILTADGKVDVGNKGFSQAFELLKEVDEKGYNPQNAKAKDLRNLFALGQLAMYYDKTIGLSGVTSINPKAMDFTATACPLAGGSGKGETVSQSHCFIAVDNGHLEAVKDFIQYVITPEVLENYLTNIAPAYPAKKAMANMAGVNDSPFLKGASDTINRLSPTLMFPTISDFDLELCALAQAVTMGKQDVPTAINNFATAAKPMLP